MKMRESELFLFISSNVLYALALFIAIEVVFFPGEVIKLSPVVVPLFFLLILYRGIVLYILNARYLNVRKSLILSGWGMIAWSFPVKYYGYEVSGLIACGSFGLLWIIAHVLFGT
jgi:hypothetical protein